MKNYRRFCAFRLDSTHFGCGLISKGSKSLHYANSIVLLTVDEVRSSFFTIVAVPIVHPIVVLFALAVCEQAVEVHGIHSNQMQENSIEAFGIDHVLKRFID